MLEDDTKASSMEAGGNLVIVVGAGVLGLTTALRLQRAGYTISIVARNLPGDLSINYASPWAGAHFRPVPVTNTAEEQDRRFSKMTYEFFRDLAAQNPESSVRFVPGIEYFDNPSLEYTSLDPKYGYASWPGFEVLHNDLPKPAKWGVKYDAWVLNSPIYLQWLQDQLGDHLQVLRRSVTSLEQVVHEVLMTQPLAKIRAVVNATGMGFEDPSSFVSRGQFLLVSNVYNKTVSHHHANGTSTVVVPRPCGGGTLIGGSKEPGDMNSEPVDATTRKILQDTARLCPDMLSVAEDGAGNGPALHLLRVNVGRRPMRRGGLRLEKDRLILPKIDIPGSAIELLLVHCYGAGGSGFKISWGAAEKVLDFIKGGV